MYSQLSPKPKGFGIGLYELSRAQEKLGNEIYVITGGPYSKNITNLKYNNISYNSIPFFPNLPLMEAIVPFGILSSYSLNQLINKNMIDLIHTHDVDVIYSIKRNNKIPLITTFHVDKRAQMQRVGSQNISFPAKVIENFKFQFNYLIWKKSSAIICISKETMHRLINVYKIPDSKIYYIPNGVNIEKFNVNFNSEDFKTTLNIAQNFPIILFIGRIYLLKGLKELLIALAAIKKRYPMLLLLIIGEIFDRSYYREVISLIKKNNLSENIKFLGNLPYSLMPLYYKAADIFILPSYSEGMPKVLLEAMASRLCVITTQIEGNKDLVKNNINGILIKPKSIPEIYQNLLEVIENKNLREKLAFNAWKTAQEYDWLNIAKRVLKVYKIVLNQ